MGILKLFKNLGLNYRQAFMDKHGDFMKKLFKKIKHKKKILISLSVICLVLIAIVLTGYIILKSYIRKMNLVDKNVAQDNYVSFDGHDDYDGNENTNSPDNLAADSDNADSESTYSAEEIVLADYDDVTDIPVMKNKDVINILLIGSDSRNPDNDRGRSDAMMILSVNKRKDTIILTSLLRDIYLSIPGKNANRLNAAYSMGGARLLMETIEDNFRIKLDGYVSVDFYAFLDIIDTIGGVTVEITEEELPVLNDHIRSINGLLHEDADKDLITSAGKHILNGKQALAYSRIRYVGTDFGRTARQRKIMEQVFNKMKSTGIKNIITILNKVLPKVTTDLSEKEIISHVINLPEYLKYEFVQSRIPVDGSYENEKIRGMDVLLIDFKTNIRELAEKIYEDIYVIE